ncbi:DUF1810 domain-containing protein [Actibacterium sp. MT2.3-13A]|uniref:DUF1810 domain-containing protein n=1 Tax=Actibacterium sp. MT2.3-13A TaxID=2828332 RepID=UPI001BA75B51|nr:DUF1810 domain-containing protein [Actibacterium sp. MT2.3-13A]
MPDLARFRDAQADTYATALAELRAGRKATHWMWFIFPQLAVLGRSATAKYYGIENLAEARAYLADPVLGPRLEEAAEAVLTHPERDAEQIMGPIDGLKLRSSATLFRAAGGGAVFQRLLDTFYGGAPCARTIQELRAE